MQLLTTGEVIVDVATGLRAVLLLAPRLPLAVTRDALTLPELPRSRGGGDPRGSPRTTSLARLATSSWTSATAGWTGAGAFSPTRCGSCWAGRLPGVLVETIQGLIGPENQTLRLAVLVYARTQGIDLDEKDLDALFRALDPANPDLGVFLDRGLERVTFGVGDVSGAVAILRRLTAPRQGSVPA